MVKILVVGWFGLAFFTPSVLAEPLTRQTSTGAIFVRDRSVPALGEAWRDPSGMIWGDIVKTVSGHYWGTSHDQAVSYCRSIGAQLPSKGDFRRLRTYLGANEQDPDEFAEGYRPQVLPHLVVDIRGKLYNRIFWSSSIVPGDPESAYTFLGLYGGLSDMLRNDSSFSYLLDSVRCVVQKR